MIGDIIFGKKKSGIPATEDGRPRDYAGFNVRMMACLIDCVLLLLLTVPLIPLNSYLSEKAINSEAVAALGNSENPPTLNQLWQVMKGFDWDMLIIYNIIDIILITSIFIFFWRKYQATPGKLLFSLRVVDKDNFGPISTKQSILRGIGYIISGIPFCLGFLWIAFNKRKRGWHDMLAGTVVVVLGKPPKRKTDAIPRS